MGKKYFGIMVQYWSEMAHQPVMRFLAMPVCSGGTAEALFGVTAQELESHDILWSTVLYGICLGYCQHYGWGTQLCFGSNS